MAVALGWNITNSGRDDYDGGLLDDSLGAEIPNTANHPGGTSSDALCVEVCRSHCKACKSRLQYVFVVWCEAEHGWDDLLEPYALGMIVRQFIKNLDANATVSWGLLKYM